MSIATAPPIGENGDDCGVNEPMVEKLRVVEGGAKFKSSSSSSSSSSSKTSSEVQIEDRDPNRINDHLQVKNKVKLNARLMSL